MLYLFLVRDRNKPGESVWLRTITLGGTQTDILSVLTLQIQQSPIHSLNYLDTLINGMKKKARREATFVMGTILLFCFYFIAYYY